MTFLDDLRLVREQVMTNDKLVLPVVGSGGRLGVRFRAPRDRDTLTGVVAAYRVGGALSGDQELQLVVDCCDEIVRRDDSGGWSPAAGEGEEPLRFDASDERWGDDPKTARDCVRKLYNLDVHPLAVAGVADALIDWMQGLEAEARARVEAVGKAGNGAAP